MVRTKRIYGTFLQGLKSKAILILLSHKLNFLSETKKNKEEKWGINTEKRVMKT